MPGPISMPEQASTFANAMDPLFWVLVALTVFFTVIVGIMIFAFGIRYRRGSKASRKNPVHHNLFVEVVWTGIPLLMSLVVFVWASEVYAFSRRMPKDALQVYVVGKQWMWHIQHANGIRENDELHVPVGKAVNLTFISQDVIHDFFVPAFRIHTDVIPGHYTNAWFEATKVGVYDLFCGQYCGTQHSEMIGKVYVMEPAAYQAWLASGGDKQVTKRQSIAESGEEIFNRFQCVQCHGFAPARAPSLVDLHNTPVRLEDGRAVLADDNYLRESIIDPPKKVVEGYQPVMASYQNSLSEDQVLQLVAFIKSLRSGNKAVAPAEGNRQEGKQQ